ncbi:MAG: HD domain-containing protein [Treponema sp.]|nr:HD domain-containing protein [Treponema sp.]
MLNSIYTFSFILSFVYLFILVSVFRNRISSYYILLFASILITNFGYMQMSDADTLKMGLYANQTVYLGGSFSSFFLFMCIADLCKTKIPIWFQTLLIIYGGILFFFVSSVGKFDVYYKSVTIVHNFGVYMLKKEYGPLHILYPLYMLVTMTGGYFIIIKSFFNGKAVSYKNSILLMVTMTLTLTTYLVEKLSGWGIPLIPIAYDISQTIVVFLLIRISMYDVGLISSDVLVETAISGIVCFDTKGRFLGADDDARNWFPEIQELKIDVGFDPEKSDLLNQIHKWVFEGSEVKSILIHRGDQFFQIEYSMKKENSSKVIHCIFIRDDTEDQKHHLEMKAINDNLEKIVYEKTKKMRRILNDIIRSMAITVENRDSNTGGHIQRTSDVVKIFVNHLMKTGKFTERFSDERFRDTVRAAYLHDFGKIAIPDKILNKPGRFEPDEYEEMKKHSEKGAAIVKKILTHSEDRTFKEIAENVAHYHHEKWNGLGYPDQISGENIPFEARIMALADVFDALVSKRVYKDSMSFDDAFKIIKEDAGEHFDPELAAEFLICRPKFEELYRSYKD